MTPSYNPYQTMLLTSFLRVSQRKRLVCLRPVDYADYCDVTIVSYQEMGQYL
jgi:hypothetical protein